MSDLPPTYDYNRIWRDVYGDIQKHGPAHHHMTRIFHRLLAGIEYATVLDAGCGPGHNYDLLTKHGRVPVYNGLDVSDRALAQARAHLAGAFWQCDIQKDSIPQTWDLVFCSLLLEHLADDDAAVRHLRAMTGHYLLVSSIVGDFERYRAWEETQGHVRNYQAGELERKLEAVGFRIRTSLYWGFPFYSPIARRLQNLSTVGTGAYSMGTRIAAWVLRWLYYLNSHRRGDMVFILAEIPK